MIIDFEVNCPYCGCHNELPSIAVGEEKLEENGIRITRSFWICSNCNKKLFPKLDNIRK